MLDSGVASAFLRAIQNPKSTIQNLVHNPAPMGESTRIANVQSPIIPVIGEMIRRAPGTISLGQGVVSYGPPRQALEAVSAFPCDDELHKYQAVYGVPE